MEETTANKSYNKKIYHSLAIKIGAIVLTIELVILLILGFFYINSFSKEIDRSVVSNLRLPIKLLQQRIITYSDIANLYIMKLIIGENLVSSMVTTKSGEVFYASNANYMDKGIENISEIKADWFRDLKREFIKPITEEGNEYLIFVSNTYTLSGEPEMKVFFKVETNQISKEKSNVFSMFIIGSIATVILTSITILLTFRLLIFNNITKILAFIKELEQGNFSNSIYYKSNDELGDLAESLNNVSKELKGSFDKNKRLNDMTTMLSEFNEAIVRIWDLNKLSDEMCRISVEVGDFSFSWIGMLNFSTDAFISLAGFPDKNRMSAQIRDFANIFFANYWKVVHIGYEDSFFICNDVEKDFKLEIAKRILVEENISSFAIFPILIKKQLSGMFALFSQEKNYFTQEDEITLLKKLAGDISIAFTSLEYEKELDTLHRAEAVQGGNEKTAAKKIKMTKGKINKSGPPRIVKSEYAVSDIITQNAVFKEQLSHLPDIAKSDSTVLIYGESGTGKEMVASAIKNLSYRANSPFLVVNSAALPDSLLESELFGHVKGSFTGATSNKMGLLQASDGGTMFLDEIGDISLRMQVKLLRVLQEREIIPIGSTQRVEIDTRFICATNKNLEQMVAEDKFREDFYFRVSVVRIDIPPLRERKDDIPLLINHFIDYYNRQKNMKISGIASDVEKLLFSYGFPGNVRELINIIEHAFVFCQTDKIAVEHLPNYLLTDYTVLDELDKVHTKASDFNEDQKGNEANKKNENGGIYFSKSDLKDLPDEAKEIFAALKANDWVMTDTAKSLGMHRGTLWRKMKTYGFQKKYGK